jgi:translation initiation factor 1
MGKKNNKSQRSGLVYSTDPDFEPELDDDGAEMETLPPAKQQLRITLQRLKGNKVVTRVYQFVGQEDDLKDLGKQLKQKCGCGGSVKDGDILLQGDFRELIGSELQRLGYRYKFVGG